MRQVIRGLGLAGLLLATGCSGFNNRPKDNGLTGRRWERQPTAASLVAYLNDNARLVQALRCEDLNLEAHQGKERGSVDGRLDCMKPRNFRLTGKAAGQAFVDIGSNDQEIWYWLRPANPPYVYHCSHEDLARGAVRQFPFQPDMILTALGMGEYDPTKKYDLRVTTNTVELIEAITSPQGQPMQKVTVFSKAPARGDQPQVMAHILRDMQGRKVCEATITHAVHDRMTGAELPRRIHLVWPDQQIELRSEERRVGKA